MTFFSLLRPNQVVPDGFEKWRKLGFEVDVDGLDDDDDYEDDGDPSTWK